MSYDNAIAIIGFAGRFPKSPDVEAFWRNLDRGLECISFFDDQQLRDAGVTEQEITHPDYVKARAVLEDVDLFDADFFGYNAREAQWMDPQQRLFLECAHNAFEHAGYACGAQPLAAGVFAGCSVSTYLLMNILPNATPESGAGNMQVMIGNDKDYLATRVSYKLNLTGPSMSVQTACSTSLAAVHMACQSLLNGECDLALSGGSCVNLPQVCGYLHQAGSIASPDGHCRPFDAKAQGTNGGSGVGAVVLKRLADALTDGDTVYAVIRGSALNNDGADKVGFTAPSQNGQAAVIAEALAVSNLSAADIGYIEAHGTATLVGDPIEVAALTSVFRQTTSETGFCAIGSVKANFGHLDAAAGIAGLLRAVMALRHKRIPASINFETPNPKIDFANSPFYVPTESIDWPCPSNKRRCAGVSAFGIGGTNVHVVLEEFHPTAQSAHIAIEPSTKPELLVLSARSPKALQQMRQNLAQFLEQQPTVCLADVAYTLQVGRATYAYRDAILATTVEHAIAQLRQPLDAASEDARPAKKRQVAFLYTGQGVDLLNAGRALYDHEPVFRNAINHCTNLALPHLGISLAQALYPSPTEEPAARQALSNTDVAQPALLAFEYAMTCVLKHYGVHPQAVAGHSLGQYAAAVTADVFDIDNALTLICKRGQLMQALPPGAMVSARVDAIQAQHYVTQHRVDLAAINGQQAHVFAGEAQAIDGLQQALTDDQIAWQRLPVERAFHSKMLDPCLVEFGEHVRAAAPRPPNIPIACNVSGHWLNADDACDPTYWQKHTRQPVQFVKVVQQLAEDEDLQFLEVGPAAVLTGLAQRELPQTRPQTVLNFSDHKRESLHACLADLWCAGIDIDWRALRGEQRQPARIALPTYPFERQRHWLDAPAQALNQTATHARQRPLNVTRDRLAVPSWVPARAQGQEKRFQRVLLFGAPPEQVLPLKATLTAKHIDVSGIDDGQALAQAVREPWDALIYASALNHDGTAFGEAALSRSFYDLMDVAAVLARHPQTDPKALIVLTTASANPLPNDFVDPFQGSVYGAVRELGVELTWLDSRCIDVSQDTSVDQVVNEILVAQPSFAVALRGSERFEWHLQPYQANQSPSTLPLKQRGVYWVVGGASGVGLLMAEYLAKRHQARLILTSRHAEGSVSAFDRPSQAWLGHCVDQLEAKHDITLISQRGNLAHALAQYCAHLVHDYFASATELGQTDQAHSPQTWQQALQVQEPYTKFMAFMIELMVDHGLAQRTDTGIALRAQSQTTEALKHSLLDTYPTFKGMVEFIFECASHYRAVLSGQATGVSVLYPDGSAQKMSEAVSETAAHSVMPMLVEASAQLIKTLAAQNQDRPLRVLEVGGGHGMLSQAILAEADNIEYCFTDIGKSFVEQRINEARQSGEQRLACKTLDISRDPRVQGFAPADFDVVLAMNVVHATSDIGQTLGHIHQLLKPGGHLVLLESIRQEPWVDMVWGLTPGWWAFTDQSLRKQSPLLAPAQWQEALARSGLDDFYTSTTAHPEHDMALMMARRAPEIGRQQARAQATIDALERHGAEVLMCNADVANAAEMHAVWQQAVERFGEVNGIIHCGMVLEDGLLTQKTRQQAKRVMQAKAIGTQVIDALAAQADPDFIALFSSLSSIDPGPGQFDYAAANAVMDSYAQSQRAGNKKVVSINWNRWRNTGYVARLTQLHQAPERPPNRLLTLNADKDWVLKEHRVNGSAILPGTAILEHALLAAFDAGMNYPVTITELRYAAPCMADSSGDLSLGIHTSSDAQRNSVKFELRGRDARQTSHAIAQLAQADRDKPHHHKLDDWRSQCALPIERTSSHAGASLGQRWQCIESIHFNAEANQAIAHIRLDDCYLADLQDHPLHPALLDVATGFACEGAYLPFAIEAITIHRPLVAEFYSLVHIGSKADNPSLDVLIVDPEGEEIISLNGYLLRPLTPPSVLRQTRAGELDSLVWQALTPPELAADEVEIEVVAAALNFKDVLLASGIIDHESSDDTTVTEAISLGAECAGYIRRLGQRAAQHWQVGDPVIATAPGALAEYLIAPSAQVYRKPAALSFIDAASLPVAWATAYYALHTLGQIKSGQRILIHSATGGVGLAAVQLAQNAGAEIFATAGNQRKRDYLHQIGVDHVMDSRSLDFEHKVMQLTHGAGVDLALGALPGQALKATLGCLAVGAKLIDLGRHAPDSTENLPLNLFERGIGFFTVNLTPEHPSYRSALEAVAAQFDAGALKPLPCQIYPFTDVHEAFRLMSTSQHIGKVILAPNPSRAKQSDGILAITRASKPVVDVQGLTDQEGWDIFELALQSNQAQIAVLGDTTLLPDTHQQHASDSAPNPDLTEQALDRSSDSGHWENETQRRLAGIWQAALGQAVTHPQANFFDLRGDSLLAISVLGTIRQQFGISLEASSLFAAPTIAQLASLIDDRKATVATADSSAIASTSAATLPSGIVLLQSGPSATPLFLAPPIMGTLFPYMELAQHIGKHRPVYGLLPRVDQDGAPAWASIEQQATFYCQDLLAVQPEGPYLLAGWSFGATVAFELACQLEQAGHQVGLFGAIDYPAQGSQRSHFLDFMRFFGVSTLRNLVSYTRDYFYLRGQTTGAKQFSFMRGILEKAVISRVLEPEAAQALSAERAMPEMMRIYRANSAALANYTPSHSYRGPVDLFRTSDHAVKRHNEHLQWDQATQGMVQVHRVGGTHMTIMRSPHVGELAAHMNAQLNKADPATVTSEKA